MDKGEDSDIVKAYKDVFTGLGCVPGLHRTHIDPAVTPVVHPPRKVPVALKDKMKCELKRKEQLGVEEKQTEPTDLANSMVTVQKPSKKKKEDSAMTHKPQQSHKEGTLSHMDSRDRVQGVMAEMSNAKVF